MSTEPAAAEAARLAPPDERAGLPHRRPGKPAIIPQLPDPDPGREGDFDVFRETFLCWITDSETNRSFRVLGRLLYDLLLEHGVSWHDRPGSTSYWDVLAALGDLRYLEHRLLRVGREPWDSELAPEEVLFCVAAGAEAKALASIAVRLEGLLAKHEPLSRERPEGTEEPALQGPPPSPGSGLFGEVAWDIRNAGRTWRGEEARLRYALLPPKLELIQGRLLWDDEERRLVLGLLLENLGADEAVRLGAPEVWRAAVAKLPADGTEP